VVQWVDLAADFQLRPAAFEGVRSELAEAVPVAAARLRDESVAQGWHHEVLDAVVDITVARALAM